MKWILKAVPVFILMTSADATVLLNDTFSDGDRTNTGLPSSGKWILTGIGATVANPPLTSVVTDGALVSQSANTATSFSLVSTFNSHTLAVGVSMILSFSVTLSFAGSASASSLRVGLFNSGGTVPTADSNGGNGADPAFNAWVGYSYWSPYGSITGVDSNIRERSGTDNILFGTTVNPSRNTSAYTSGSIVNGTTYQGSFRLTNDGSSLTVAATLGTNTQSWTDTSPSATSFDALGFFAGATPIGANGSFTLDNVMVETIPAPSSAVLAAIAPVLLLRRRR